MFKRTREDIRSIMDRDPAARSAAEVFLLYPGLHAVIYHRVASWFLKHKMKFIARWVSQTCKFFTGIEIHPAAKIGRCVFIDHGTGVIIGETAEVGDYCTIYQGVTLGGTGKDSGKRHPTLGNNVLVGAGAKVLGPFKVGDNSKIAANAVLLMEVPPNSTCAGVPARIVRNGGAKPTKPCSDLDQVHIPDPVSIELCKLYVKVDKLEKKLAEMERQAENV